MSKRINIVLPDQTLALLDKVATKGRRSQFISRAVLHFVESQGKENLRDRLKREALDNSARDLKMAAEWFPLEQEASQQAAGARRPARARKTKVA